MYFTTPEGRTAFWIFTLILAAILPYFFHEFVWKQFMFIKRRKYEERQRQKLLDQQNNTGRRIFNRLDDVVKKLNNPNLWVDDDQNTVVAGCGDDGFLLRVLEHRAGQTERIVTIGFDMFGLNAIQYLQPIRVRREGMSFDESWRIEEKDIVALLESLESYIRVRFTPVKI